MIINDLSDKADYGFNNSNYENKLTGLSISFWYVSKNKNSVIEPTFFHVKKEMGKLT